MYPVRMAMDLENLPSDVEVLKRIIAEQNRQFDSQINVIRSENKILREQVRDLKTRLFGKKSEKLTPFEAEQARLFNELEAIQAEPPELPFDAPKTQVASHERSPRRKFVEAEKVSPGNADTREIIEIYRKLYEVEATWRREKGSLERLAELRNLRSRPLIQQLEEKLRSLSISVNSQSKLGMAVSYTFGEWPKLVQFLDNPAIPIDNNAVEN